MAIVLPLSPAPSSITPRLLSKRLDQEPTFGGSVSRVRRLGSKWAFDVELPSMMYVDAMAWVAALSSAEADTVLLNLPQPGFVTGSPGNPLVNGVGQLGSLLNLDGFSPYTAKAGQWFSLIMGGRRYVHQVAEDKTAASGAMAGLKINPMLRRSPADNTVVEFAQPKVEGFLSGRETTWTVDVARTVGLSFTITERE